MWVIGLIGFIASSGEFRVTMPRQSDPPVGEHNLAAAVWGPSVSASSFISEWPSHHHPLFAFDQRARPDQLEKWASDPRDRRPWIEVRWREERTINRLVIQHAGFVEDPTMTIQRYRMRCLKNGEDKSPAVIAEVHQNTEALAVHVFHCTRASGVRLDLEPNSPNDVVRIYEIEVWGQ
jgi:hypothetical protein